MVPRVDLLAGEAVAASYTLPYAGRKLTYQFGRDPGLPYASLSTLMLIHIVSKTFGEGVTEYAFLRGAEPYKYRFANSGATLATVAIPRGAGARAVSVACAAVDLASPGPRLVAPAPAQMGLR